MPVALRQTLPAVLLVTRNLPPLRGGMERVNLHMAQELAAAGKLAVIGPQGCREHLPAGVDVVEIPVRPLPLFLLRAFAAARRMARVHRPGIVIAGSGLTAPMARLAARRAGAKCIAYVHGLDLVTRHRIYRLFWRPALRRLDHAFANSASTADIARRLGVARGRVSILHPGVTMPETNNGNDAAFRSRHGLGNAPLLLSVGRMTGRKGLVEFVRQALPRIHARYPDIILAVIGDEAPDALHGQASGAVQHLIEAAGELGLANNLRMLGTCDDATLSQVYFAADVHVFPVREVPGDIEGFGMVAMEAAAHGLPTVAFAVGGIPDAVHPERSGCLVKPGDYLRFADEVCGLLALGRDAPIRTSAREFAEDFRWECFGERLRAELRQLGEDQTERDSGRHGHAVLDLRSRDAKARKIERLLGLQPSDRSLRLLEIGTGSGGIAHYFATHPDIACEVDAVDITDTRQIRDGYQFALVDSPRLPFPDASFDVVLTNHVIEHVGDEAAQRLHLDEVRRVMKADGVGYLAVPNRWMLTEPHYQLKFLSWWPHAWRTPYLRLMRKGTFYDCEPLQMRQLEHMLDAAGLRYRNVCIEAWRATFEIERPSSFGRHLLDITPNALLVPLRQIIPTLIYQVSRKGVL